MSQLDQICNIAGYPMYSWAIDQLRKRSEILSNPNRTEDQINYLGNKGAWVRVVSSVNLEESFIKYFREQYISDGNESTLAKEFILFGGTSVYESRLRSGINQGFEYINGGSYGTLGPDEVKQYGYRAMPGITSMTIESIGRMGSVRQATVNFRVSDKMQLDVMDALYFRPGFTLLIEYGHAKYINNDGQLKSTEELMINPFKDNSKEDIGIEISKKIKESAGNYGGMLSIITSFNFSITQDGGYDCVLRTIAMGGVMGNYPINNLSILPDIYIENAQNYINQQKEIDIAKAREDAQKAKDDALRELPPPPVNDNWSDITLEDPLLANLIYNLDRDYLPSIISTVPQKNNKVLYEAKAVNAAVKRYREKNYLPVNTEDGKERTDNIVVASSIKAGRQFEEIAIFIQDKEGYIAVPLKGNTGSPEAPTQNGKIEVKIDLTFLKDFITKELSSPLLGAQKIPVEYDRGPVINLIQITTPEKNDFIRKSDDDYRQTIINTITSTDQRWEVISITPTNEALPEGVYANFELRAVTEHGDIILQLGPSTTAGFGVFIEDGGARNNTDLSIITEIIGNQDLIKNVRAEKIAEIEAQFQEAEAAAVAAAEANALDSNAKTLKAIANSQSALELMLRSCMLYAIDEDGEVNPDTEFIQRLFSEGAYSSIFANGIPQIKSYSLDEFESYTDGTMNAAKRLEINLRYGNSAYLMSGENIYRGINLLEEIEQVDFQSMFKIVSISYGQVADTGIVNSNAPIKKSVYINLGCFFLMLNHTGLLYNSKKDNDTLVPVTYVDFNPSTNYYLSSANQFSVDPFKFILPYRGGQDNYKKLFKKEVLQQDDTIKLELPGSTVQPHPIFDFSSGADQISSLLPNNKKGLQENQDGYIGRTMDVMVNINYLLDTIKRFSTADDFGEAFFQSILENITATLNKSTGYYNAFRLAYSDSANVYMIVDDHIQLKPDDKVQTTVSNILNSVDAPEIPIQGKGSIARSFDFRTDMSSRLASMIAISANPGIGDQVGMSKNASDFGIYNIGSHDRYMKIKTSNPSSNSTDIQSNVQECQAAISFDTVVSSIYGFANNVESDSIDPNDIQQALAYYKEKMARIKNEQLGSVAAMIIPIKASITMDGFSGMYPFQLFTINENMLPYRYSSKNLNNSKVAFSIARISHNFSNNEWVTSMNGNMTFLNNTDNQALEAPVQPTTSAAAISSFTAEEGLAKTTAEEYLGSTISSSDWTLLVRAAFGESTSNQKEQAYVMATILNRVRTNYSNYGTNITAQLYAKSQFQAVTGTVPDPGPNPGFRNGPDASEAKSLYGGVVTYLKTADKSITNFTSNNEKAYGRGTDINYLYTLRANPKSVVIGGTIFSPKI